MKAPHYLSRFHQLLYEAAQTAEKVDGFDLRSNDIESVAQWGLLLGKECDDNLALIDFIVAHHRELYSVIQNRGGDDDSAEIPD